MFLSILLLAGGRSLKGLLGSRLVLVVAAITLIDVGPFCEGSKRSEDTIRPALEAKTGIGDCSTSPIALEDDMPPDIWGFLVGALILNPSTV